jgi:predicted TIM-barrel fold metal-dependent hydrolase
MIAHSDPSLLSNLFLEYPNVRFDVFHMGYPYHQVLSAVAKMFPNVYIDMCWAHIISPQASVDALVEWLDAVPANKISAFGGDYALVDGVYGHQAMARDNVSRSLAIKVEQGVFDVERACEIARWLFVDNPIRIFQLEGKL